MTELMRYESELANEGLGELKRISDIAIRILDKQVEILQAENAKLKAQLTWRPVSEKPEKGQYFLANPSQADRDLIIDACPRTYQFLGECSWEKFVQSRGIVRWLPIPPMKESE